MNSIVSPTLFLNSKSELLTICQNCSNTSPNYWLAVRCLNLLAVIPRIVRDELFLVLEIMNLNVGKEKSPQDRTNLWTCYFGLVRHISRYMFLFLHSILCLPVPFDRGLLWCCLPLIWYFVLPYFLLRY